MTRTRYFHFSARGLAAVALAALPFSLRVQAAYPTSEPGIPVTDPLVVTKCGGCHRPDSAGNLSRISWIRTTPEGWEEALKRMVRLNGLSVTPDEARHIVQYLATDHGLAPEEEKPVSYFVEKRMLDEDVPKELQNTCNTCHAVAQPMSWRRPKEEWVQLVKTHIGYFPVAEATAFYRPPVPPDAAKPDADKRQPWEVAVDYLAKTYPLHTPAWEAFHTSIRQPKLDGRWLVTAYKPGSGPMYGEMTIEPVPGSAGLVATHTTLTPAGGGRISFEGKAIVYAGYAWRGRSHSDSSPKEVREVMMLSRDGASAEGRWLWGGYQEFGYEVKMVRARPGPSLLGLNVASLHAGSDSTVDLYGANLPAAKPSDLDFGAGVTVSEIVSSSPGIITARLHTDASAQTGPRDVAAFGVVLPSALAVYQKIDYIKVNPGWALSRLGGTIGPKGFVQFEAIAYSNGPDNKPNTPDDVMLGPVPARWSMKEFYAVYGDDDTKFVGNIDPVSGLFSPAGEGPDPERKDMRNNYGDVWIVATVEAASGKPLTAQSYLVVTVPQYLRFDQPEVNP